ncbi:hypothetical protein [Pseudomonas sp. F3-2]
MNVRAISAHGCGIARFERSFIHTHTPDKLLQGAVVQADISYRSLT